MQVWSEHLKNKCILFIFLITVFTFLYYYFFYCFLCYRLHYIFCCVVCFHYKEKQCHLFRFYPFLNKDTVFFSITSLTVLPFIASSSSLNENWVIPFFLFYFINTFSIRESILIFCCVCVEVEATLICCYMMMGLSFLKLFGCSILFARYCTNVDNFTTLLYIFCLFGFLLFWDFTKDKVYTILLTIT